MGEEPGTLTTLESGSVSAFLKRAGRRPAGLLIEGEAGIGKSTVWSNAMQQGAEAGFQVLSARASVAEAQLTFSVVADLLANVDASVLGQLPTVQRVALDRLLLRGDEGPVTDERVAAAALQSVLRLLAEVSPVLVAIDDLPWLDRASRAIVSYAVRRLDGSVGVLATARTGDSVAPDITWLQFAEPEAMQKLRLEPMSLGSVHRVIAARLGRTLSRPLITRIHQISGGNPFYALELAQAVDLDHRGDYVGLPSTLATLVDQRLEAVHPDASQLLLMAACTIKPTVTELAQATETHVERVVQLLESAELQGLIELQGNRVRFTHPLLSHGVYARASASQRRQTHRALAALAHLPELRARHLALAAVDADESTLQALDKAADIAAARGAPSAAAELLELALGLGGDDEIRRLRAAEQHFRAGSFDLADRHLQSIITTTAPGMLRAVALMLRGAVYGYGDRMRDAVAVLTEGIAEAGDNPDLRVRALMLLSLAIGMTGDMTASVDYAQRAVRESEHVADTAVRSQALALWVQVSFIHGYGTDEHALQTALELEDPDSSAPATLQASAVAAVNAAWTGRLREASVELAAVKQRCLDRGNEVDLIWADQFAAMVELWSGRYSEAARIAEACVQHAEQVGGQLPLIDALTVQAAVDAYRGHEHRTRQMSCAAIEVARKHDLGFMVTAPTATLGFLEVSLRNYEAALDVVQPLLDNFDPVHGTEIMVGGFLPDAIEALVALGRYDDAEPLIAALLANGTRLDRPWMLAMGARGRAMSLAGQGNLDDAMTAATEALHHHQRLPMPFEEARTQLLIGQLQRRRRQRQSAVQTLDAALQTFETLGAPLWVARAHTELARVNTASGDGAGLTPSERRIAQRAAAGLSNRDIAAELFVSPKTVETNLSRVYRKLGIRSRAQLHAHLVESDTSPSAP